VCNADPASGIVQLTSYTPACAGTACGKPTSKTQTCASKTVCTSRTLNYSGPSCDPATDYCGPDTKPTRSQDCGLADGFVCNQFVTRTSDQLVVTTGGCDQTKGTCTTSTASRLCPRARVCKDAQTLTTQTGCANAKTPACTSSDRLCNLSYCIDANGGRNTSGPSIETETGCSGNACASATRPCSQVTCLPNGDSIQEAGCSAGACITRLIPGGCT
jgi:hypothetical protein